MTVNISCILIFLSPSPLANIGVSFHISCFFSFSHRFFYILFYRVSQKSMICGARCNFFLGHWCTKQNYKFSKNIEKPLFRRVSQRRFNFAPGAANHTFFDSPCIYLIYVWFWKQGTDVFFQCSILSKPKEYKVRYSS